MTEQLTPDQAIAAALDRHRAGRLAEAEGIYRQVLQAAPDHPAATRMLGMVASQCGKHADAITLLNRALALHHNDPTVALDLAIACRAARRMDEADAAYRVAIAVDPPTPAALSAYGQFLRQVGRSEEAIPLFSRVAEINPTESAFNQLGIALAELNRFEEATAAFRRCIDINPNYAPAYNNFGTGLLRQQCVVDAEPQFRKAIELDPNYAQAYDNLGSSLIRQDRQREAIEQLERAIAIKPDFPQAHENLAWALIALGDWTRGFAEYEWRLKIPGRTMIDLSALPPQWAGEELNGRSILLHAEAGLGDAIMCIRYVPLVAKRGGRITLLCSQPLARLFGKLPGVERTVTPGDPIPRTDTHCSLMSLPHVFDTTPTSVPSGGAPYLTASPEDMRRWRERLSVTPEGKRVGLVWGGNPRNAMDAARSVPLALLGPIGDVPDVTFYSVQKGPAADQLAHAPAGLRIVDATADLRDMADTAAFLKNLDLIITPDTAVAHLAAALGRPTVVMLTFAADCRWMLNRSDTPWYSSMRLFRQKSQGDWTDVIERVARSLKDWSKK